ncbi:MAG: phosphoribosylamine--glycine ligase [Chloroflexi bacterium]|nr:phosphoribosylamine--glycine ligase [Chloroflexota bacterium]
MARRVLVVGSGGREHALLWSLSRSQEPLDLFVAPGNGGTGALARNMAVRAEDIDGIVALAREEAIDLVVVGPEAPLALGLVDRLQEAGIAAFGPTAAAARVESSKAFSKALMRDQGIPSASFGTFTEYASARDYLEAHPAPIVLKADGLAAGKGVLVCQTDAEAQDALRAIMVDRQFGEAGSRVVIEEYLTGQEVSVLAFADGRHVVPMVLAQDHKPAYDGDRGPNTGGMGCFAPAPLLDAALLQRVTTEVLQRALDGLEAMGCPYVGVLYAGLMVRDGDYKVLEFNCRFGDPETQVILPLLETDLLTIIDACLAGSLDSVAFKWSSRSAVCVVMASGGYPGSYERGLEIQGLERIPADKDLIVFHAGTRREGARVLTDGGRVLGLTALGDDLAAAMSRAYAATAAVRWPGAFYRRDIGTRNLAKGDR